MWTVKSKDSRLQYTEVTGRGPQPHFTLAWAFGLQSIWEGYFVPPPAEKNLGDYRGLGHHRDKNLRVLKQNKPKPTREVKLTSTKEIRHTRTLFLEFHPLLQELANCGLVGVWCC